MKELTTFTVVMVAAFIWWVATAAAFPCISPHPNIIGCDDEDEEQSQQEERPRQYEARPHYRYDPPQQRYEDNEEQQP